MGNLVALDLPHSQSVCIYLVNINAYISCEVKETQVQLAVYVQYLSLRTVSSNLYIKLSNKHFHTRVCGNLQRLEKFYFLARIKPSGTLP